MLIIYFRKEFPLHQAVDVGGSISGGYLQEFLYDLPFVKDRKDGDSQDRNADASEGEYEIYDQDSDDAFA